MDCAIFSRCELGESLCWRLPGVGRRGEDSLRLAGLDMAYKACSRKIIGATGGLG